MAISPQAPESLGAATPALDAELAAALAASRVPGLAAAVIDGEAIVWARAFGLADATSGLPMTPGASQAIASITKTVTATLLLRAADAGQLDLDAPLETLLAFPVRNPHARDTPIALRQILTHTSSLGDGADPGSYAASFQLGDPGDTLADDWAQVVFGPHAEDPACFHAWAPGARHAYANAPWALCAAALRAATGVAMPAYFRRHLAEPLGLRNSSFRGGEIGERSVQHVLVERGRKAAAGGFPLEPRLLEPRAGAPWHDDLASFSGYAPYGRYAYPAYPDGGLYSNVLDLARYLGMWLGDGAIAGRRILAAETVAAALAPQLPAAMDLPRHGLGAQGYRQCLAWIEDREAPGLFWHEGGDYGTRTAAAFDRGRQLGVAVIANAAIAPFDPVDVLLRLLAEFGGPSLR